MMPAVERSSPGHWAPTLFVCVHFSRNNIQAAAWILKFTVIVCVKNHVWILFHFYTNLVEMLSPLEPPHD